MAFFLYPGDIAFGIALAFLAGIFLTSLGWNMAIVFGVNLVCGAISIVLKKQVWKEVLIFFSIFTCGVFYFHFYLYWMRVHTHLPTGKESAFTAIVSDEPQPSDKYLIIPATLQKPYSGIISVFAPPGSDIGYGDLLKIIGVITPPDATGENPAVFSPKLTLAAHHKGFFLREWMIDLKLAILAKFNALLPADQAALLGGIAFGSKQNFKPELKQAMALAGLTHLVAISGYNITIVIFAVGQVFGRFFSRRVTFVFGIIFLGLFMLMVGGAASGIRAAIMGFMALVAREAGEAFSMRNGVTITGAIMAILDPTILTTNLSFILSFLSLLGIVYLGPPLRQVFHYEEKGLLDWKDNAITTLSAQLAVMPVLMGAFGQFSATAIVANVLVLGTVPFTMFLGVLVGILGFISRYLAFFAGMLTGLMLGYQLGIIRLFAKLAIPLPFSFNSEFTIFFYYLLLALFICLTKLKQSIR